MYRFVSTTTSINNTLCVRYLSQGTVSHNLKINELINKNLRNNNKIMLSPSSGTGQFIANSAKIIRFVRKGCTNRPFFHIVVAERNSDQHDPVIEQVGTYDPIPNEHDEKLVSLNYERLRYWIGNGADTTKHVEQLLGLAGFYPVHPSSYMTAWRNRRNAEQAVKDATEKASTAEETASTNP